MTTDTARIARLAAIDAELTAISRELDTLPRFFWQGPATPDQTSRVAELDAAYDALQTEFFRITTDLGLHAPTEY